MRLPPALRLLVEIGLLAAAVALLLALAKPLRPLLGASARPCLLLLHPAVLGLGVVGLLVLRWRRGRARDR